MISQAQQLSASEQAWLANKGEIIFVSQSAYPPFEFIDEDQSRAGMCIDLVRWIATEFGFQARFRDMSFEKAQQAVLNGEADVITSLFYSKKRDRQFDFTYKTWDVPALIFVKSERPDITNLKSLQKKRLAMQRGDYAAEFLDAQGIGFELLPTNTFGQAVTKIITDKADAVIGDKQIVLYHLFSNNLSTKIKSVGVPLYTGQNCMGLREGATQLQSILNKGIRLAQERGIFSTIEHKWMGTIYSRQNPWYAHYLPLIAVFIAGLIVLAVVILCLNRKLRQTVDKKTKELSQREAHLRTMLETIPDMIWLKDPNGVYLSCNSRFERFFGAKEAEIVGKNDYDFMNKEIADFFRAHDQAAVAAGKPCMNEEELIYADDGHKELLETIKTPMYDDKGELVGVFGIARDITERKRAEKELLKIRKLESVGILAGGIAHDFNNILTAISGNISLATTLLDPRDEAYDLLQKSERASLRAKDLTQQLLTFAKGGDPVRKIAAIAEIIYDSAGFILSGSNVRCDFRFAEELWPSAIDSGQISQVIQNIIVNANQAMPNGGVVKIDCSNFRLKDNDIIPLSSGDYIKIVIKDQGIGIPAEMLEKIFDPYFTTKEQGNGLGLAITHSIIRKHDGYISVESERGRGTTFTIYLPAFPDRLESGQRNIMVSPKTGQEGKVMIMDDDEMIRSLVEEALSRVGYEVISVEDGDEAVLLYKKAEESGAPVDVIIMDLTIPGGLGGKNAIRKIHEINPTAKVIVSSGYSNDPVMAKFRDYGFCAAMIKPFQINELIEFVGKAVSG